MTVGGQAVLEGVMMRSPWRVATAVRDPEGIVRVKAYPFVSLTRRNKLAGLPVLRGALGLFEALKLGIDSLGWSGEIAAEEDDKPLTVWDRILEGLMFVVAFALGIGLFMATPYLVAQLIEKNDNQIVFHLIAGGLRILLLLGYMAAITLIPDIKRVFQYHGAEHKSIFTFEKKLELSTANACSQSRLHPRCGTSFLILAAVLTMLGFMALDSAVYALGYSFGEGSVSALWRVLFHLPFIPLVAGLSYEVLRLAEKHAEEPLWQPAVKPGFWLQHITTREPDEEMVEVALAALKESLLKKEAEFEGVNRVNGALSEEMLRALHEGDESVLERILDAEEAAVAKAQDDATVV